MALVTNKLHEVLVFGEEPTRLTSKDESVKITKDPRGEIYDLSVEDTLKDYATKEELEGIENQLSGKQDTLIEGTGIKIENNVISFVGGQGLQEVSHDNTLVGKGVEDDKLGVNTDVIATKDDIKDFVTGDDLEDYAKKEDIPDVSNFATKDEIPDVSNFPTKDEVASEYQPKGDYALVGDSYTKEESDGKYALKGDVPTDVYTKEEADNKFQEKGDYVESSTLNNYYTKTEIENNYYSKEEASGEFQPKGEYVTPSDLEDYATKDEIPDVSNLVPKREWYQGIGAEYEEDHIALWYGGDGIPKESGAYTYIDKDGIDIALGPEQANAPHTKIGGMNIELYVKNGNAPRTNINYQDVSVSYPPQNVYASLGTGGVSYQGGDGVYHSLANKQDKLVSGETIKTINGESLLGSGDIELQSKLYHDETLVGEGTEEDVLSVNTIPLIAGEHISIDMVDGEIVISAEGGDLSNYYTKEESDEKYALKDDVPSDVYTKSEADERFQEKGNYATKDEIPDVSGFATKDEIPDISGLATKEELGGKQDTLIEGDNITIVNNEISAHIPTKPVFAGSNIVIDEDDTTITINAIDTGSDYEAGSNISIVDNVISCTIDLDSKQDTLVEGVGIKIEGNVISTDVGEIPNGVEVEGVNGVIINDSINKVSIGLNLATNEDIEALFE